MIVNMEGETAQLCQPVQCWYSGVAMILVSIIVFLLGLLETL
jgi:hypothetical protein